MADSDIRDNISETSKLNESLLSSIKATEDLKREIDILNKQKVEPAQAQARLSATAGPTLSPAEEMRRAVQTAIRQSAQATVVRPPNPLPSRPTETIRPPLPQSPTSTVVRPPQTTQPTSTTINPASSQRSRSKVEVLQATPKDSTRQEAASQRNNMGKGAASGWAWVGEHGKELVHFQGGETVLSHDKSVDKADKGLASLPGYASGTPNPPPPPPNPHPLDPYIQRLNQAIDTLNTAKQAGIGGGTAAGKQLLKRARLQAAHLANRYARLTPQQQQAANSQLQQVSQRMKQVESEEIERRRKLNNELTRGQYAVAEFAANLAGGRPWAAAGALAGGMGGIAGGLSSVVLSLVQNVMEKERNYIANVRTGGATASPSLEATEKRSKDLSELYEALRTGELKRKEETSRTEQLRGGLRRLPDWSRTQDIQDWMNFWQFSGEASRRQQWAKNRYALNRLRMPEPKAEAEYQRDLQRYYLEQYQKRGLKPPTFKREIENPGGEPAIMSSLQYQSQLQINALQRRDITADILQEQLKALADLATLLSDIRSNTNGLERINPVWIP